MKTDISIPNPIFKSAQRLAEKFGGQIFPNLSVLSVGFADCTCNSVR